MLDLTDLDELILLQLVQALYPGTRELDVKLNVCVSGATGAAVQSLLRSNVTSLSLGNSEDGDSMHIVNYLALLPHLHVLALGFLGGDGDHVTDMLVVSTSEGFVPLHLGLTYL